jgi:hypothetical protein
MAQPGDPHAAEREARQAELRRFADDHGTPNGYAAKAHSRALADLFYLARWRTLGAVEAGRLTCDRFGHDARGRVCERCLAHVV